MSQLRMYADSATYFDDKEVPMKRSMIVIGVLVVACSMLLQAQAPIPNMSPIIGTCIRLRWQRWHDPAIR